MYKIILILVGGNLLAQIVNAIFIPISTRLYSPEDFKDLSIFVSFLMIISVVGGARFDAAIIKSSEKDDSVGLLLLSIISASLVALLVLVVLIGVKISGVIYFSSYYWLLPPLIIAVVLYNSLVQIANIKSEFKKISRSRISQASTGNITLAVWGYVIGTPIGLIVGYSLMYCAGIFALFDNFRIITRAKLKEVYFKYVDYPKYSVIESLSDVAGYQLPIALIGIFVQGSLAGYLFISIKIMNIPITILAKALSNIFIVKIRSEKNKFSMNRAIQICFVTGLISLSFAAFFFQHFSESLLGEDWNNIGNVIFIILPWFLFQFMTTVFNPVFYIFSKENFISKFQVIANVIRITIFSLALYLDEKNIIIYLSGINALFYTMWLFAIFYVFKREKNVKV